MKITKARYDNAKKKIRDLQQFKKVIDEWDNAVKDCPFKEHVTAITIKDGNVKMECESPTNGKQHTQK